MRTIRFEPDAYPTPDVRSKMLLTGVGLTAVWYGGALGASYMWPDAPGARDLRIPVAGPWLALGDTGCAESEPDCSVFPVVLRAVLTIMDGVGQAAGLFVFTEGMLMPTTGYKAAASGRNTARRTAGLSLKRDGFELTAVPMASATGGYQLGLVGRF